MQYADLIPKMAVCFKEGYTRKLFFSDLFAGASVAVLAIPLSLAFAIASGLKPEQGLFAAIVGGFLVSLLGGSRVQIGGPAGAFVVLIYSIVQRHGYEGLLIATLIAGILLIFMGLARFGVLLKFIPYPVTTGFTAGLALIILTTQIKDFFGLKIDKVPPTFVEKCSMLCQMAHTWSFPAVGIAVGTVAIIVLIKRLLPKCPGAILAVLLATLFASFFGLPVETIGSKFGEIPRMLSPPTFPSISLDLIKKVFPDAVTVAMLCAIESLLCAVVADGMTGQRHRPNCELIAQGIANIAVVFFGGMPVTGTIARTSTNIRFGGQTPVAGMFHAVILVFVMLSLAPFASKIPLASLAGVLVFVAWNMMEVGHFIDILKGPKGDALVLLLTFLLTVLISLTVAVQVGVMLAAIIFLKRMTDKTSVEICQMLVRENQEETPELPSVEKLHDAIPKDVVIFEIKGPFFYSVADLLDEALSRLPSPPKAFLLRLDQMPLIDATGLRALKTFAAKCKGKGILFLVAGISSEISMLFRRSGVERAIGKERVYSTLKEALLSVQ